MPETTDREAEERALFDTLQERSEDRSTAVVEFDSESDEVSLPTPDDLVDEELEEADEEEQGALEEDDEEEDEEEDEGDEELAQAIKALKRMGLSAKNIKAMGDAEVLRAGLRAKEMLDVQARQFAASQQGDNGTADGEGEEGGAATPAEPPPNPEDAFREFADELAVGDKGLKHLAEGFTKAAAPYNALISQQSEQIVSLRAMVAETISEMQRVRLVQKDQSLAKAGPWKAVLAEVKVLASTGSYEGKTQKLFDDARRIARGDALADDESRRRKKKRGCKARGTSGAGEGRRREAKRPGDRETQDRAIFDRIHAGGTAPVDRRGRRTR